MMKAEIKVINNSLRYINSNKTKSKVLRSELVNVLL